MCGCLYFGANYGGGKENDFEQDRMVEKDTCE